MFTVLVNRALLVPVLETQAHAWMLDWDESDAFLRPVREELSQMNTLLKPMWDFGPWTMSYYDRVTIYPLTSDGFAEGYTPEEGTKEMISRGKETNLHVLW